MLAPFGVARAHGWPISSEPTLNSCAEAAVAVSASAVAKTMDNVFMAFDSWERSRAWQRPCDDLNGSETVCVRPRAARGPRASDSLAQRPALEPALREPQRR